MVAFAKLRERLRQRAAEWARRRQGADRLPLTLARRRLYILPTRAGMAFGALVLTMLIAALNYANSLALLLAFLLAGFALVAMHECHRNLLGLSLLEADAPPLFAGSTGILHLTLQNASQAARYRVQTAVVDHPEVPVDLPPAGHAQVELSIHAARRGLQRIDRLRVSSSHPFGLFRVWTWVHAPIAVIVYPRATGSLPLPADRATSAGTWPRGAGGSDEWFGLRPFRDGDSPRQVAWKAYAREAPLLVKEYSSAGSPLRMLSLDAARQPDIESRLAQLARWIVDAEAAGELYGLELPGELISPHRGPDHRHRCLTALALYGSPDAAVSAARMR
ncbi:MAG TPA: DUF58 domain-containing protein [Steroidobacteraceae bacterium]|nr:DUF58 domain-containing protein [Steroidobacteraceae bacterium]